MINNHRFEFKLASGEEEILEGEVFTDAWQTKHSLFDISKIIKIFDIDSNKILFHERINFNVDLFNNYHRMSA